MWWGRENFLNFFCRLAALRRELQVWSVLRSADNSTGSRCLHAYRHKKNPKQAHRPGSTFWSVLPAGDIALLTITGEKKKYINTCLHYIKDWVLNISSSSTVCGPYKTVNHISGAPCQANNLTTGKNSTYVNNIRGEIFCVLVFFFGKFCWNLLLFFSFRCCFSISYYVAYLPHNPPPDTGTRPENWKISLCSREPCGRPKV